jgi:Fic family protein
LSNDDAASRYAPFPPFAAWKSLHIDADTFAGFENVLRRLREATDPERLDRAVRTATRLAAIDTGAIEGLYEVDRGFTMTIAVEAAAWEAALNAREPVVRRSFEDALRAYDFVLDLATNRTEVTEKAIKEIHALICTGQETYRVHTAVGVQKQSLPKDEYKRQPNNPTIRLSGRLHHYAPPTDVTAEMDRLVGELRSAEFTAAHPVLQAAYAHYALVAIHPFADGNGRVARALASVYLYRRPGAPLVIFADQKDEYIDALEAADAGSPHRFVRFIQDRVHDVIGLVQVATAGPDVPPAARSIAALRETFVLAEGLSLDELDTIAERIRKAALSATKEELAALELPSGIRQTNKVWFGALPLPQTYRDPRLAGPDTPHEVFSLNGHGVSVSEDIGVAVKKAGTTGAMFLLVTVNAGRQLPIELREVFPIFSSIFTIKLRTWADAVVRDLLARFDQESRNTLRAPD